MNRRAFLATLAAAPLAGCDFSLADGLFNACKAPLPAALREHPLVRAAWRGIDATKVWDCHCHVFGNGHHGSGLWINPKLEGIAHPAYYARRKFFLNAACADEATARTDATFVDRLVQQCEAMPAGFRALLLAFDWARDGDGARNETQSTFHVPDAYVAGLAKRYPQHFEWAASIHPYDPQCERRLEDAAAGGARAVKWLPTAQGIDPADERCTTFYDRLAKLKLPLITHAGAERAVGAFDEEFGNPLRLQKALNRNVDVVVAHCASLGTGRDTDGTQRPNFELFSRMMDNPDYASHLSGDISGITLGDRAKVIPTLIQRREWHARLRNGSDYPLPGVVPRGLAAQAVLDLEAVAPLRELRDHNVLLFDFVLKRSLTFQGAGFSPVVFETRPYFSQAPT